MGLLTADESAKLLKLGELIQSSIASYVQRDAALEPGQPASQEQVDAGRNLIASAGVLLELVSDPGARIIELSNSCFETRALHIAADARIPDLVALHAESGVDISTLSGQTGIEAGKLLRIMRTLCSGHVFREVAPEAFANNRISAALVDNDGLRSFCLLQALQTFTPLEYWPRSLYDPIDGPSYTPMPQCFQQALGTKKPYWEWLEEKISVKALREGCLNGSDGGPSPYSGLFGSELARTIEGRSDDELLPRPELAIFSKAMIGHVNYFSAYSQYDFPWQSLGSGTVVDVGGGLGTFCLGLSQLYPDLKFVVQDREAVLKQAEAEFWPKSNPQALAEGRVQFMPHTYFAENPVKYADVYWFRAIMHSMSDENCAKMLAAIKPSMGPKSRVLLCEYVMNNTLGDPDLPSAPEPLPANWGYCAKFPHNMDLICMTTVNGMERTKAQFAKILDMAGLKLRQVWTGRSYTALIEAVLPDSSLL
ncbi:O-methyltransferase A [Thozetella sp. PMI_491]|nr:O-methyltransferase A [Thozetella sp. PMI_491]